MDEKQNKLREHQLSSQNILSINNIEKRSWKKIGKPIYKITKVRDPETLRTGILVNIKLPKLR